MTKKQKQREEGLFSGRYGLGWRRGWGLRPASHLVFCQTFRLKLRGRRYRKRGDPEAGDDPLVLQEKEFAVLSKSPRPGARRGGGGHTESQALGNLFSACPANKQD